MPLFQKKPITVVANQWFKNGDHPEDQVGEDAFDPIVGLRYQRAQGKIVKFFRRPEPEYAGNNVHELCGFIWHNHGWIETLEGGHTVCPGDWIITGIQGEYYPCKPDIFIATYELVPIKVLMLKVGTDDKTTL